MTTYTNSCIEGKVNEDAVGLTEGEREWFAVSRASTILDLLLSSGSSYA
jgi:hypothetical protein